MLWQIYLAMQTLLSMYYAALEDADVIISSLGNIQLQHNAGEDRFAEFPFTREAVYQVSQELKKLDFKGILLVISNPVDAVSALYQEFTGWPRERVIGTGTLLDTARMKAAVGDDLSVNPKSVSGYNLGEHGNSQFTAWSQVKVKGQDITELTSEEERQNLFMASMKGGHKVFYGKGYTSYGIASAALSFGDNYPFGRSRRGGSIKLSRSSSNLISAPSSHPRASWGGCSSSLVFVG